MPAAETIPVSPAVLVWARKTASVKPADAARAANVTEERLARWEAGTEQPTMAKLRALAKKYRRPLSVMALPSPPAGFQPLHDFRRVDPEQRELPPRVAFEIRLAQERREAALEMLEEAGESAPPFTLRASISDDPETVADRLRRHLNIGIGDPVRWAKQNDFDRWRTAAEAAGILVFVMGGSGGPKVRDVRGFAVPAERLPIVAVNGRDKSNGRTFTLLHEVAHLLLGEGVVDNAVAPHHTMPAPVRRIERWANAAAAAALMPKAKMQEWAQRRGWGLQTEVASADLADLATAIGASREAVLIRLVGLGLASRRGYVRLRPKFEEEYAALDVASGEQKKIPHHTTMVNRYGRPFARLVLNGYHDRRLSMSDAAGLLGVQAKWLPYVERQAFKAT